MLLTGAPNARRPDACRGGRPNRLRSKRLEQAMVRAPPASDRLHTFTPSSGEGEPYPIRRPEENDASGRLTAAVIGVPTRGKWLKGQLR